MSRVPIVILDFGSQTTQLIARRVRAAKVYCEIHPCTLKLEDLRKMNPAGVILSGGPASVYEEGAPRVDPGVFELGVPVLGICYGMQIMAQILGGKVTPGATREFGRAAIEVLSKEGPFTGRDTTFDVWMSHGDHVEAVPEGFSAFAKTSTTPFASMGDTKRHFYGLQFHPEVQHTQFGADILGEFVTNVCRIEPTWTPNSFVDEAVARVKAQVGDGRAICGLSGGVDSSVAAVLVAKAIGSRLTCIFVDNGLLRGGEAEQVLATFREHFKLNVVFADARERFLSQLAGVTDPEQKRKIIGRVFIEVFEEEAKRLGGGFGHLVQGTLYPDVIESVSFKGPSVVIKSHHNVGGLPERMHMKLVEPLRELFKDEVREAGAVLGIPDEVLHRHPFPGPGLAIRVLSDITADKLRIVRESDTILQEEMRAAGLYRKIWQAFTVLLPVRTVGVVGDGRSYDQVVAVRAVSATDGMTADFYPMPYDVLSRIATRVCNEVRGVGRVVYDVSSKPPATIEWE
ncbi:MAG: glutamine-hydrolyzing GMP synthase [Polyangiaceae bacterium]